MFIDNICCIGAGHVGGPTMAYIAYKCPNLNVTVVDKDVDKIKAWNSKNLPLYEPGLDKIVKSCINKNLFFTTDVENTIKKSQIIFITVNTPTKTSGVGSGKAADLTYIEECSELISKFSNSKKIIVEKSTVPVRTAEKVNEILIKSKNNFDFEVLSCPEFLSEGCAIENLSNPDRVLIGGNNTRNGKDAINSLIQIYANWVPREKIITTNIWSSELSKLMSNAFLAQRISSINSVSAICDATEARISEVSLAIGLDKRIGKDFLNPSLGFGGSCFKKDILNIVYLCENYGLYEVAKYWNVVLEINEYQKSRFSNRIVDSFTKLNINKKIALLGWSFKKQTSDSRESAAIDICDKLLKNNFEIHIYDPKIKKQQIHQDLISLWKSKNLSQETIKNSLKKITIFDTVFKASKSTNAISILTEWDEFKELDFKKIYSEMLKPAFIFDGRNIIDKNNLENIGFKCYLLGNG